MANEQRSRIKIRVENTDYDVVGGDFRQILTAVKALPNRRFDGQLKLWHVTASLAMVRGQLENSGFTLEGGSPVAETEQATPAPPSNDRIKLEIGGHSLIVTGAPFQTMLEVIKSLPGRRFDSENRQWQISGDLADIKTQLENKDLQLKTPAGRPVSSLPNTPPASAGATPLNADSPPPLDDIDIDADINIAPQVASSTSHQPPPPPALPPDYPFPDQEAYDVEDDFDAAPPYFDDTPPPPLPQEAAPTAASGSPTSQQQSGRRDQIRVIVKNTPMLVVGGPFREMLAAIKDIPGRRFDGESKQWLLNDDLESIQQHLAAKGFQLEE